MGKEKKSFNVDDFLAENEVTVVLKGKEFSVRDVPEEALKHLEETSEPDLKGLVQQILGCSDEDLEGYGIVALTNLLEWLYENLFPEGSSPKAP